MGSLQTRYMGITLANPIIAGASDLTSNIDSIKRIEEAGAGAVVLKSLFEEQIQLERFKLEEELNTGSELYGEMASIFPKLQHAGAKEHLMWVKKSRAAVKIPVFASLNAVARATWVEYARQLADQGVDGLELNFFATPRDFDLGGAAIEEEQLETVRDVRKDLKIPIAVKLSVFYANPLNVIGRFDREGVNGFVLFNRFFQPDIDLDTLEMHPQLHLSSPSELLTPLRWIAILHGRIDASLAATGGIHDAPALLKALLAGADVGMIASVLYQKGVAEVGRILAGVREWMDENEYNSVQQLKGSMSYENYPDPAAFQRGNYMKTLTSYVGKAI